MMILSIDPGSTETAFVLVAGDMKPIMAGKVQNSIMHGFVKTLVYDELAIEMVASYGMAVGAEVFETVFWIGVFWEAAPCEKKTKIYRKDVKVNLCNSMKAKDANIRQALIDRFGIVGTKKAPGWFFGFSADMWSAYAVAVTYYDAKKKAEGIQ